VLEIFGLERKKSKEWRVEAGLGWGRGLGDGEQGTFQYQWRRGGVDVTAAPPGGLVERRLQWMSTLPLVDAWFDSSVWNRSFATELCNLMSKRRELQRACKYLIK
jgi:hypothetical protein